MPEIEQTKPDPRFRVGDRVKIRHIGATSARVVELRGPLAPGGVQVYGIRVVRKVPGTRPIRTYIEVTENELELIPARV